MVTQVRNQFVAIACLIASMAIKKEKEAFLKKFGKHVRKLRTSKGLSIREIELEHDIRKAFISDVENGKLNFTFFNLKKIADYLDLEIYEIFKDFKK